MKPYIFLYAALVGLALMAPTAAIAQNPLTNGLVAYYPFDGTANDVSGNGYNGTDQAAVLTTNQFGADNDAFYFNGTDASIIVPTAALSTVNSGTLAAWVYVDDNTHGEFFAGEVDGANTYCVFSVGEYAGDGGQTTPGTPGELYFHARNGAGVLAASTTTLQEGLWYHVAATFSTTNCTLYVNGAPAGSFAGDFSVPFDSRAIDTIGAWESKNETGFYDDFNGNIDSFAIYNRSLAAVEVLDLFTYGFDGIGSNILIGTQPVSVTTNLGSTVTLSVGAYSGVPLNYQWQLDGTNLAGATNDTLNIANLQFDNTGVYDVVVSDAAGSVTSASADVGIAIANAPTVYVNSQLVTVAASCVATATVTLVPGFENGLILYTLTGANENGDYQVYTGPFTVTNSVYITAVGYSDDFSESAEMQPLTLQISPLYNLSTSVVGGGVINLDPETNSFPGNSVVTLTAVANSTWAFDHWQGSVTNYGNPLTLTVTTNLNIQAVFLPAPFTLTLSTMGGGFVSAAGQSADGVNFVSNSLVTLTASNHPGWTFLDWQGGINNASNPCTFAITQTTAIQGVFGTSETTNAVGGGQIVLNNPGLTAYGSNVTASAVANDGNYFVAWGGAVNGTNSPVTTTIRGAGESIDALFLPLPAHELSLSVAVLGNGSVSISPQQAYYNPGAVVTLSAAPAAPSGAFYGWMGGNNQTNLTTTVTMTTNLIVYANFSGPPPLSPATAVATVGGGSCISATVKAGGSGYTNIPVVTLWGGGGIGATATAVVQNGVVVAVNIVNGGSGYTNTPLVVIQPPFTLTPQIHLALAYCLSFSNLAVNGSYLLQSYVNQTWESLPDAITVTNAVLNYWINGKATASSYRIVTAPLPATATAAASISGGLVVGATVISGGSGYASAPAVTILGGGGGGARATATVTNGAVSSLTIVSPGGGYTNTPTITIAAPPLTGALARIQPGVMLGMSNLMINQIYQLQSTTRLGDAWQTAGNGAFLSANTNQSAYFLTTNAGSFYLLQNLP